MADGAPGTGEAHRGEGAQRGCGRARWQPIELVAMILGFIVFWPIGLAILAWKFWQRRSGYPGDLVTFGKEGYEQMRNGFGCGRRAREAGREAGRSWGAWSQGWPQQGTGNRAFDEWKSAELERLEEERRKLEQAQREFAEYLAHLRQARDREEFERFRRERDASTARGEPGWKPFDDKPAAPQG
ncbi:MAG: DUF2852 domain-containing protein [Methylobacteriaceae bacterium]|nr:DUF2852 domain-containing protein [Methylobacteriaceae bacterium]